MRDRHGGLVTGLAIAVVITLLAGVGLAVTRASDPDAGVLGGSGGIPGRRSTSTSEVSNRPWPQRVPAPGPWTATLSGSGDRFTLSAGGVVVGGLGQARFDLGASDPPFPPDTTESAEGEGTALALADGSRWYPSGSFRLEGEGDLPFTAEGRSSAEAVRLGEAAFRTAQADDERLSVRAPSLDVVLASARGPVAAVGRFVARDGTEVERLPLPPGSRVSVDCPPPAPDQQPCSEAASVAPLSVEVTALEGMTVQATGDGEAAVAGRIHAEALGQSWDGLVGAIEARQLNASVVYRGGEWAMTADGANAHQVWIDVWPVVDTILSARSVWVRPGFFDTKDLKIEWKNVGYASSQIIEAEGVGSGASQVEFDLNKTVGHDAGLDVRRGDWVVNLEGGGDIDSNLPPGGEVSRRLSAQEGTQATIILRGNFPDAEVPLAIPPA